MIFRIIRGAVVGAVLGLLIGVGLSGAMYMYKYMEVGAALEKKQSLIANSEVAESDSEGNAVAAGNFTREQINNIKDNYDYSELQRTLDSEGINGVARNVASINSQEINVERDSVEESLLRFHVRGNSNSDVDVELKYRVRDAVLYEIEDGISQCVTREEATEFLTNNIDTIEDIALKTIRENGFNYSVDVYLTEDYFPIRQYGEVVLPAGIYEALRIDIGLGEGENFWCVLYPMMCYPVDAVGVISKEDHEELETELTPEQYKKLFIERDVKEDEVEIRFKLFDLIFGED